MPCIQNRSRLRHSQNSIATREPIRTVRTRSQLRCMPSETAKPDMTTYIENSATGADKLPRVDTDFTTPLRWGLAVLLVGFGGFAGWAAFAPLDAGITANAVVQVAGSRKAVQHQEGRSEEHTSELQSLMRSSYAVFCLKKKQPINKQ